MTRAWWAAADDPRRASRRTWTGRGVATGTVASALVAAAATLAATSPHASETTDTSTGWLVRPSVRALAADCSPTEFVVEPASKIGTVDYDGALAYSPAVPVSGWFSDERADPADPDATPEQVLHGMWFGDRVVWVAPDAPASVRADLVRMVADHPQWGATVRDWPADRPDGPEDGTYAAAAWGVVQTCVHPDADVIADLFAAAPEAPGADGTLPPVAVRTSAE